MNHGVRGSGGFEHERRTRAGKMTHLVGLVVMNSQAIALTVFDLMNIMSQAKHLAAVLSSKRVVLPEPFGPIIPTIAGAEIVKSASSSNVTCLFNTPRV
jgi:hypothetical protein